MGLLPDTWNCGLRIRREWRERFPYHRFQRKPLVNDPGMHQGTCVTHAPWYMSGSLTGGGRVNVPGIPGPCATCNFTYLVRGPSVHLSFCLWVRHGQSLHFNSNYNCQIGLKLGTHKAYTNTKEETILFSKAQILFHTLIASARLNWNLAYSLFTLMEDPYVFNGKIFNFYFHTDCQICWNLEHRLRLILKEEPFCFSCKILILLRFLPANAGFFLELISPCTCLPNKILIVFPIPLHICSVILACWQWFSVVYVNQLWWHVSSQGYIELIHDIKNIENFIQRIAKRHFFLGPLCCHQMETFFVLLSLCVGNPPVTNGFPSQRDSNVDLWCFFIVSLNKLMKRSIDR